MKISCEIHKPLKSLIWLNDVQRNLLQVLKHTGSVEISNIKDFIGVTRALRYDKIQYRLESVSKAS